MKRPARPLPPLDAAALERMALRYVERFATTRAKLSGYLSRKIRERGWDGDTPPDTIALAERFAELGYVDDRSFGEARASAMARRGLGARRVTMALRHAGIDEEDRLDLAPAIDAAARASAFAFARRRRLGPFAVEAPDRPARERALGAFLRAGHSIDLARSIVDMSPGDPVEDNNDQAAVM